MANFKAKLKEYWEKDPVKVSALGVSSLGLAASGTNLVAGAVGRKKQRKAEEASRRNQIRQIDAMERLADSLNKVNKSVSTSNKLIKDGEKNFSTPSNKAQKMIKFVRKNYSIEDGGFRGGKDEPGKANYAAGLVSGALVGVAGGGIYAHETKVEGGKSSNTLAKMGIGAAIGAGLGAFTTWMCQRAAESNFNSGKSEASSIDLIRYIEENYYEEGGEEETTTSSSNSDGNTTTTTSTRHKTDTRAKKLLPYEIDQDPRQHTVTVALRFGVLIMYINNPISQEIALMNQLLDNYCRRYKNADYKSETVAKNCYLVEVQIVANNGLESCIFAEDLIVPLMKNSIKVNFISGNRINLDKKHYNTEHNSPRFKRKEFSWDELDSISDSAKKMAGVGAGVGTLATLATSFGPQAEGRWARAVKYTGGGLIAGAALGALWGLAKKAVMSSNRRSTVDARLMQSIVDDLVKTGFKDGVDFTRDPKTANDLNAKVSFVITKSSGELSLLVNMVSDSKLKQLANDVVDRLPNTSAVTKNMSDRYNDINITTMYDTASNTGLIAGLSEYFIRNGYPVYLVEVG